MIGQTISHYKILEKLGEGGMGIVYKAHDTKLDRIVALKFLPSYLTSDAAEKERFYHEARAASALNHQNVTTIYEIDEHDNQVFLAMEQVEGKTLRALVSHEPMSIKKILDIAMQACEGLAAAHEKHIVHRDIKSDNMMVTNKGQVKIMDFGLAKLKGATKLTKAGSTLGTAAYMSPEQAQGEEVDHRSDIFSFGVVVYEMLTSHLPFRGEHHAALMYSLINEDPQPIARFNDKVSPELERIVYKALAKDRDERYQHVDDMLADLRRERKNLEYARTGYIRATAAQPTIATQQIPSAEPVPKKKNLKLIIAGAIAVVLVTAFFIFNPFKLQVTQNSTAETSGNSLAVMYFENIPDPDDKDHTGAMLTDLLITALSQTKGMEVISRERLYDIQKELGQADTKTITPATATKVAQRAGVTTMLLGSILQKEPALAITTRLIDVKSGKILGSQRVTGFSSAQIFSLIDTLALLVRNDLTPLGGAGALSEAKSVASVTANSPEAYRSYIEGVELNDKFYVAEAQAAFRKAIELDSNFAMAYYSLAFVNTNNIEANERRRLVERAWQLKDKVNERERLQIQAAYVSVIENDPRKAIEITETFVQRYPHEQNAYSALGTIYGSMGRVDKSVQTYQRGLAVDSLDKNLWNNLAYGNIALNRKQDALIAINRYIQIAPAEPNPYDSKGDIYFGFGDLDSAEYWWRKALTFRSDFNSTKKIAYLDLIRQKHYEGEKLFLQYASSQGELQEFWAKVYPIFESSYKGQLNQTLKQLNAMIPSLKQLKRYEWLAVGYRLQAMIYYEQGNYPAMLEAMKKRMTEIPHQLNEFYDRDLLAFAYLKNGKKNLASQIIHEVERDIPNPLPQEQARLDYYAALLANEDGKYDETVRQFKKVLQFQYQVHAPLYFYAISLLKSGHTSDAIDELQRATWWISFDNTAFDLDFLVTSNNYIPISTAKAHYWLGVAYEQQGEKDKAIKEYETFLELWKDADFDSKELKDARVRVSKLKGH